MTVVFASAIFLSSALLFWLEPLFGKMVLPLLGGAPQVWNACVVFYQLLLIVGYAWAHAARHLGSRRHMIVHLGVSLVALLVLPFAVPAILLPPSVTHPLSWMFAALGLGVGLPFAVIAANGPLLQRTFARGRPTDDRDPYFLYAASNLGSAAALLLYPLVFERYLTLHEQTKVWRFGYLALVVVLVVCATTVLRPARDNEARITLAIPGDVISWRRRLRWMALAAIPSSLMLGVTSYISAEVAPVPLIWILPLTLYLATLVAAFAATGSLSRWIRVVFAGQVTTRAYLPTAVVIGAGAALGLLIRALWGTRPAVAVTHLLLFTLAALICHTRLAANRPPTGRLTEYYLWMAVGGGLGGAFNTFIGPLLFTSVLEYPLALAAVVMVLPPRDPYDDAFRVADFFWPVGLGLATAVVPAAIRMSGIALPFSPRLLLAVPALAALAFSGRPVRFGGALVAIIVASTAYPSEIGSIEYATRNFFSVHRVLRDDPHGFRWLTNGVTVHGGQRLSDSVTPYPLTYYSQTGPAGDAFRLLGRPRQDVGVIGLGAGALMYYGVTGQRWTFFEIDPAVREIAEDPRFFTFLTRAKAPYRVVEGDARLSLERDTSRFDILVLDAFASDAVPVHLLTRESMRLYASRLKRGGVMLMHISNRFYDLGPLVGVMARDARLIGLQRNDTDPDDMAITGKFASHWVVLAQSFADVESLRRVAGWTPLDDAEMRPWTDDYSSVLPLLRGRGLP